MSIETELFFYDGFPYHSEYHSIRHLVAYPFPVASQVASSCNCSIETQYQERSSQNMATLIYFLTFLMTFLNFPWFSCFQKITGIFCFKTVPIMTSWRRSVLRYSIDPPEIALRSWSSRCFLFVELDILSVWFVCYIFHSTPSTGGVESTS